jgi:hypothetical protein
MENNKPIASVLQKAFVEKTKCDFLETIMQICDEKVITNNDDVEINSDSEISSNASDELSTSQYININHSKKYMSQIDRGMRLGSFLSECGWLDDSIKVLSTTLAMIQQLNQSHKKLLLELNCLQKLIHVQALFCCYKEASTTTAHAVFIIDQLNSVYGPDNSQLAFDNTQNSIPDSLLANFYHELSVLHFYRSGEFV